MAISFNSRLFPDGTIMHEETVEAGTEPQSSYLENAMVCLQHAFEVRIIQFLEPDSAPTQSLLLPLFEPAVGDDPYSQFVRDNDLDNDDQLLLLLALMPWVDPGLIDRLVQTMMPEAGDYPQIGGARGRQHRGFLPTGDTALFLLAGSDMDERLQWHARLTNEHPLVQRGVIFLDDPVDNEPPMSGRLNIDNDNAERLLTGKVRAPRMSFRFPAQRLETGMEWDDLVLPNRTLAQVRELENWVANEHVLMDQWAMSGRLRPGCRALFFGPPGTGKTFTATLLGKATGREVYRVDLSLVISKYIGETEKNLAALFDKAEHKDWILFFDEADALFGKRSALRDSHDRYANQEVSFLLQRVEIFHGLVVLASNLASNVDEAFARRFEQVIYFPMPSAGERHLIWRKAMPANVSLEPKVDFQSLAANHKVSGGMIMNIVRYACLQAISRGETILRQVDFTEGIRREYAKENRLE